MSNNPFLEERISIHIRAGANWGDDYNVEISQTAGGAEHRKLVHPYPARTFVVSYVAGINDALFSALMSLHHRVYSRYGGFRAYCLDDFSTNGNTGAPTALDQTLTLVSTGVYQLQKTYGLGETALGIGLPSRVLYKPVAGTALLAVGSVAIPSAGFSVDTTTGQVTFIADKTYAITAITKATSAVVTIGTHTLTVNESVHVSGVAGMTQINGLRGLITAIGATTVTLAINSTSFSTYTSGGAVHSRPQAGESITGGCQFDIPVRFNSKLTVGQNNATTRNIDTLELVELLNP